MAKRPRILVVNDDGIHGEGLLPLIRALESVGDVTAVVPEKERSAESHSLTLHKPLRLRPARRGVYMLNGSPADCARLGSLRLLRGKVDLIASGINRGYNLGQDVVYSGTVAAAMEGTLIGFPSFAVSLGVASPRRPMAGARAPTHSRHRAWDQTVAAAEETTADFAAAAAFARTVALQVLKHGLPAGVCLNVNVPASPRGRLKGVRVARLGKRVYEKRITMRSDPVGNSYFWLMGREVRSLPEAGTDVAAVQARCISVTPLSLDNTAYSFLSKLRSWPL